MISNSVIISLAISLVLFILQSIRILAIFLFFSNMSIPLSFSKFSGISSPANVTDAKVSLRLVNILSM